MIPKKPAGAASTLLEQLNQQFTVFREGKPLALGIHKTLLDRLPDLDPGQLRLAMKSHTQSTRYLKSLVAAQERFDLDGQVAGEVTEEQRQIAQTALAERFARVAERRRTEARAKVDAARQAKVEQERQAKLAQLVARFNQR